MLVNPDANRRIRTWVPTEQQLLLADGSVDVRAQLARWDAAYNAGLPPARPRPEDLHHD